MVCLRLYKSNIISVMGWICNQDVGGSNPASGTLSFKKIREALGKNTLLKAFKKEIQEKRDESSNGLNSMQLSVLKPSGY